MQGVVPAAGQGTRLRPHTHEQPKGLVEIAGQPLLAHCFDSLLELDVDGLVVVVGYRGDQLVDRFGDTFEGVPVEYVVQEERLGLADAVGRVADGVDGHFVLLNGDNVFDADLSRLVDRHQAAEADATLLVDEVSTDAAAETGVLRFEDDELAGVVEKPVDPPSTRVTRGCYAFSPAIFHACHLVRPSDRGEYELSDAIDLLLSAGRTVETVGLAGQCVNVNAPEDIERAESLLAG